MARCAKCGKQVVAGVVLCSQCYEGAGSAPATAEKLQKLAGELETCAHWAEARLWENNWEVPVTMPETCAKAAAAIRQLLTRVQEAERQRDAAVTDLQDIGDCGTCIHDKPFGYDDGVCLKCTHGNYWEWRGVKSNVE